MDKPIKLRAKPIEVEAMQYNGKNATDIARWVHSVDPMAVCENKTVFPIPHPLHFAYGDGSTSQPLPAYQYIQFQSYHGYDFRLFVGAWIFKDKNGNFSPQKHGEVKFKYDLLPESPTSPSPAQPE